MRRTLIVCLVVGLVAAIGCATPEPPPLRSIHGQGFLVQDDGCLEPKEEAALFAELAASRKKILEILGPRAAIGDFRAFEERGNGCPPVPPPEIRVAVLRTGVRCHADETGLTILRGHLDRRDATHELVHFLAGSSWRPIDEGFAVYVTEKLHGPAWGVSVDIRARVYFDLGLDEGLDRDRVRVDMSRRDYDLAGSFVKFLVDKHGLDKFLALYAGAPGDFHTVYGQPESELVARWRESVKQIDVKQSSAYYRFRDRIRNLK